MRIQNWTLAAWSCLLCSAMGCQLQRSWLRNGFAAKAEDPAYLLDPATECRTVAAMASETRDDLNAFTADYHSDQMHPGRSFPDHGSMGTTPEYPSHPPMTGAADAPQANYPVPAAYQSQAHESRQASDPVGLAVASVSAMDAPTMRYAVTTDQAPAPVQTMTEKESTYEQIAARGAPPLQNAKQPSNIPAAPKSQLVINGVERGAGPVRVAVFQSAAGFPSPQSASERFTLDANESSLSATLERQTGSFAVAAFQDLNNDGQLNRSAFGVPKEPFGFSGQPAKSLGPPSFQNAAVSAGQPATIKLIR